MSLSQKITKKLSDTEFVCKLCDMIDKYPQIINWNEQGDKMIIFDIEEMSTLVLPQYFRHGNFPSFIRQLNMYDFHKLYKENKLIAFENQFFKRGNQSNYHFIQRKKKIKQQQLFSLQFERKNQTLLKRLRKQPKINSSTKKSIQSLLEFKYTAQQNNKKIYQELQNLHSQLKDCRSKKISQALKEIKNNILEQLRDQHQLLISIDRYLVTEFLVRPESIQNTSNHQQQHFQMGSQFYLPLFHSDKHFTKNFIDCHNMASNHHSFMALPSHYSYWSATDLHQCMQPLFYSGQKLTSQADFSTMSRMKYEESESEEDDGCSMEKIPQEQLGELFNNNGEQKIGTFQLSKIGDKNTLKCEAE